MLFQIGPVTVDVFPFNADTVEEEASADLVRKEVLGTLAPREFMGPGDEKLTLSGQLLPGKLGGLTEVEILHGFRRAGTPQMVLRGDGRVMGWFAIESLHQSHTMLGTDGLGQVVHYELQLVKVPAPDGASMGGLLALLLSLF